MNRERYQRSAILLLCGIIMLGLACTYPNETKVVPAPVTDFHLLLGRSQSAVVSWTAPANAKGSPPVSYDLRFTTKAMESIDDWNGATRVIDIEPPGSPGAKEKYIFESLQPNSDYYAAIRVVGENGALSEISRQIHIVTADSISPNAFTAEDFEGYIRSSTEWNGQPVVLLNFWGVWCGFCIKEMPDLIQLHNNYTDRGLTIIGFNYGDSKETALNYADNMSLPWTNLFTPREVLDDYDVHSFPTTIFLDSTGTVLGRLAGAQTYSTFAHVVEYLLGDSTSTNATARQLLSESDQ